jgi:hypothetical protein
MLIIVLNSFLISFTMMITIKLNIHSLSLIYIFINENIKIKNCIHLTEITCNIAHYNPASFE